MHVTFETSALKDNVMLDDQAMNKLTEIKQNGVGWGTPGPKNLYGSALHCHYSYSHGMAFVWRTCDLHILALGKKNSKAKSGNSGYDWSTTGDI